ncbi:MAG: hypothetical protein F6J93_23365 [Oscillatoria sp. SIO1A7]|nr:hypothetical protein [Oscillatoria sp. SIO1A7]
MPDRTEPITKEELRQILIDWGSGQISSAELKLWMEVNYFPIHIEIGPEESELTQRAMNCIMNEFELGRPESFIVSHYQDALEFLDFDGDDYEEAAKKFVWRCFGAIVTDNHKSRIREEFLSRVNRRKL